MHIPIQLPESYSSDIEEDVKDTPLKLYLYRDDGMHTGPRRFSPNAQYPYIDEILTNDARELVDAWTDMALEVRITNGGDRMLLHSRLGMVIFPPDPELFWRAAGATDKAKAQGGTV